MTVTNKNIVPVCPQTEGIKYAGSKLKILPHIIQEIKALQGVRHVLDGFSGTTRVSQALYQLGYDLTTNDLSVWSAVFARCYFKADKPKRYYEELITHLNHLKGEEGWFSTHYGGIPEGEAKRPFQLKNTKRLDAIRPEIDKMNIDDTDRCVLLTSLILALDAVDNTLGHHVSYMSGWSSRSYKDLHLKVPRLLHSSGNHVEVLHGDVFAAIDNSTYDLAYFDPPYGSNNEKMPPSRVRYASYYHIWKSIILNDCPPLFGKANRREDSRDGISPSIFEAYQKDAAGRHLAMKALNDLVTKTQAPYVLLSYSSGGRATKNELIELLHANGRLMRVIEMDHKRHVMSLMTSTNRWVSEAEAHKEYLFLLEK